ncbi:ribosomal-processing cysteine protease Prp [Clostridium lundense]|uniref:ribosomal-processing cysteine protease Prp n=1 Tax=Clostridium lundense TaxID=319475 RepID=UPI000489D114|nr:ribosomal-processing cysteine protease Prp [Clostridium lundense]
MINAVFKKRRDNLVSFNIKGHADSVDEGYDLVCSAVSAISLAIANGITEVVKAKAYVEAEDGFLNLSLEDESDEMIHKCGVLMDTMLLGLKNVELSYGEYIKVKVEEVE